MVQTTPRRGPAGNQPGRTTLPARREPLWRHALGERLRRLRRERGETLQETARRAGLSPQYLSEIERGIKEPSSEMIAAVTGALGVTLLDLTAAIAHDLAAPRVVPAGDRGFGSVHALAA